MALEGIRNHGSVNSYGVPSRRPNQKNQWTAKKVGEAALKVFCCLVVAGLGTLFVAGFIGSALFFR